MASAPYSLARKARKKSGEAKDKSHIEIEGDVIDESGDKPPQIPKKISPYPVDDPFAKYRTEQA